MAHGSIPLTCGRGSETLAAPGRLSYRNARASKRLSNFGTRVNYDLRRRSNKGTYLVT
jgi:hypothetical protein